LSANFQVSKIQENHAHPEGKGDDQHGCNSPESLPVVLHPANMRSGWPAFQPGTTPQSNRSSDPRPNKKAPGNARGFDVVAFEASDQ
jgi:hypothetical protein